MGSGNLPWYGIYGILPYLSYQQTRGRAVACGAPPSPIPPALLQAGSEQGRGARDAAQLAARNDLVRTCVVGITSSLRYLARRPRAESIMYL